MWSKRFMDKYQNICCDWLGEELDVIYWMVIASYRHYPINNKWYGY